MTLRSRGGTLSLPLPCNAGMAALGTKVKGLMEDTLAAEDFAAFAMALAALAALVASATACASSSRAHVSPCAFA